MLVVYLLILLCSIVSVVVYLYLLKCLFKELKDINKTLKEIKDKKNDN